MDKKILDRHRKLYTDAGYSEKQVNQVISKLSVFDNIYQAQVYDTFVKRHLDSFSKMSPEKQDIVQKKIKGVKNMGTMKNVVSWLNGKVPSQKQLNMAEGYIGTAQTKGESPYAQALKGWEAEYGTD